MRIGVISDTHNYLDPRVPALFAGVDHICHGGDIGLPKILMELENLAPVTAVQGNTDDPAFGYRLVEMVQLEGRKFLLQHIVEPHCWTPSLEARIGRDQPEVVIFGHTHKPFCERIGNCLFFNPGYAGKARFALPRSVALLHCGEDGIRPEYLPL